MNKASDTAPHAIKLAHGTVMWFQMVGAVMVDAAQQAKLSPTFNLCLVERYTDGIELSPGLAPGLRFDIAAGQPSFRVGARHDERGDITVEVTSAASRTLNTLYASDPKFREALERLQADGQFRLDGDLSQLGDWFDVVHDRIVERTS
jgi:hypothetical protein